ncbi:hypothetical protein E2320_009217 [Naja naja]|nr:hypothetical protein E2320_009217 [Naja naja]
MGLEKQLHRLTAASVIRDNEIVAQREAEVEHGFFRRFRLKAVQSSKACNLPSMFTSVVPVESSTKETLPLALQIRSTDGVNNHQKGSRLVNQRHHSYSLSLGQRQDSQDLDDALNKKFLLHQSVFLQPPKPDQAVLVIPLDRLCRASPYPSHRASLSPASSTSPWALIAKNPLKPSANQPPPEANEERVRTSKEQAMEPDSPHSPSTCSDVLSAVVWAQADSLEAEEGNVESTSWATAVALAWLEHRCAGFFVEWELLAAKADCWLRGQQLPEGLDVATLKGAARQLFLLLRHWDENIKLNMLCYNPNNM